MKVVGVISSANRQGNGATLAKEALKAAEAEGATVSEIFLPGLKIEYCQGCLGCMASGECHQPDDFEELRKTLKSDRKYPLQGFPGSCIGRFVMKPMLGKAVEEHKDGMM